MFGPAAPLWQLLATFKIIKAAPGHVIASIYPVLPWFGIMATGYGMGRIFLSPAPRQQKMLVGIGLAVSAAFVVLRLTQLYGDPKPWEQQATPLLTVLSFLNCSKYPPSLLYTAMTLGPALILLDLADRLPPAITRPLSLLGRVPLFFYLLHLPLFHAMSVIVVALSGRPVGWMFADSITVGHTPTSAMALYGVGLGGVYGIWALGLILLYPLCRVYARIKDTRRYPWLTYL